MTTTTQPSKHITAALEWLSRAQDIPGDGGVSAWFSYIQGWRPSYVETTGYIINTFLDCSEFYNLPELKQRALAMADFLLDMQLPSGAYRVYSRKQSTEDKIVVFDMGQDLLGMTQAYQVTGKKTYLTSAKKAADFLISIQEPDGSWLKHTYGNTTHTYHTRVAWGILKVYALTNEPKYKKAGIKNLEWASQYLQPNGWLDNNHFPPPHHPEPFTHALSYATEGFLWSGLLLKEPKYVKIALRSALPMLKYYLRYDFLPGTLNEVWKSDDQYSCLTGDAQISLVWLTLFQLTGDKRFWYGGIKMNSYLKKQQSLTNPLGFIRGAIPGSDPIWGDLVRNRGYCRLAYPNWAAKFYIDALLAEEKIRRNQFI
jgi:hypothetical protein